MMGGRVSTDTVARFFVVGVVNTMVGYGTILLLQYGLNVLPVAANAGGYAVGWLISYVLNRRYTFRSNRPHRESLPLFLGAAAVCYLLNLAVLHVALSSLALPGAVAQAAAVATYSVSFYLVNRYAVFRRSSR